MLFKTKLLLSLCTLGTLGGMNACLYYSLQEDKGISSGVFSVPPSNVEEGKIKDTDLTGQVDEEIKSKPSIVDNSLSESNQNSAKLTSVVEADLLNADSNSSLAQRPDTLVTEKLSVVPEDPTEGLGEKSSTPAETLLKSQPNSLNPETLSKVVSSEPNLTEKSLVDRNLGSENQNKTSEEEEEVEIREEAELS